ncbi:MAG: hypothetical protein QM680_01610 [Luteolibacter sp.]
MESYHPATTRGDGKLWAFALGLSVGLNLALIVGFGVVGLHNFELQEKKRPLTQAPARQDPPPQTTLEIYPEMLKKVAPASPAVAAVTPPVVTPPPGQQFARTSDDQRGKRPDKPAFMGERDTEATSDRAPDPSAPPLPSQSGIEPKHEGDIETTQSHFRDGKLPDRNIPAPEPAPPTEAFQPSEPAQETKAEPAQPSPPPSGNVGNTPPPRAAEKLLAGPNPVEVPVPAKPADRPAETAMKPADQKPANESKDSPKPSKPKPKQQIQDPAFSGFQRKTAIRGSISRTGRSSLAVEDSPLGRYQAAISRAVELEWQRNCVRHRDFITPGFLTLRFTVQPNGKVKSVKFIDGMQTGEVQKGFTLNSIRDAAIPPMPEAIRKDYAKEPLELIFNFYF